MQRRNKSEGGERTVKETKEPERRRRRKKKDQIKMVITLAKKLD